jgi:hypothetical protein
MVTSGRDAAKSQVSLRCPASMALMPCRRATPDDTDIIYLSDAKFRNKKTGELLLCSSDDNRMQVSAYPAVNDKGKQPVAERGCRASNTAPARYWVNPAVR